MSIIKTEFSNELENSMLDYALSVITDRALPAVEDGLKPVQRRILYSMDESGNNSGKPHQKCARAVGNVMGQYHPHGDSSIYGALVRLSQPWSMRYPLIDFHGNCGSQDGDGPASMRYTEARLSKTGEELLLDIKKKTVDFKSNFSEDLEEPVYLPGRFPNLLVNPTEGIAVGLACSFAPHNIKEIADAISATIDNESITIEELLEKYIVGPDFPTGGIIINKNELLSGYKTGSGRIRVRGKYHFEKQKTGTEIVFTEIPYGVKKDDLVESFIIKCNEKKIEGISGYRDESDKHGMRMIFELSKGVNEEEVLAQLFKNTRLEDTYGINQVALVNGNPKLMGFKDLIQHYINHQRKCIKRKTEFELEKAIGKLEIVNGLLIALEDINNVIKIIQDSASAKDAKLSLEKKYNFSENQSEAIVEMKLRRLAGLEKIEIQKNQKTLLEEIDRCKTLLSVQKEMDKVIKENINSIAEKYKDKRRTEITQIDIVKTKEIPVVKPIDVIVTITKNGEVRRVDSSSYKVQNRNGKGIKNEDGIVVDVIKTNTVDSLMMFSNAGRMYRIPVNTIPEGAKGVSVSSLVKMLPNEECVGVVSLYKGTKAKYAVFTTKQGMIKKTTLEEYSKTQRNGVLAIKLKDGDSIVDVTFLLEEDVIIVTKKGYLIRFKTKDIPPIGRVSLGVKAISLTDDDEVSFILPVNKDSDDVLLLMSNANGKKFSLSELPCQNRGGKGLSCSKDSDIKGAMLVEDKDNVLVVGGTNTICIAAKDIPLTSRTATGVSVIKSGSLFSATKI